MAMLDRHVDAITGGIPQMLKSVVPVEYTQASRLFYELSSKEYWDHREDFISIKSPFALAWYEAEMPRHSNNEGVIIDYSEQRSLIKRIGFMVTSFTLKKGFSAPSHNILLDALIKASGANLILDQATPPDLQGATPAFVQCARVFYELADESAAKAGPILFDYLDANGKPIMGARVLTDATEKAPEILAAGMGAFTELEFAISMMHCKNASLNEEKIDKAIQRRRSRNGKMPLLVFKHLEVRGVKDMLRTVGRMQHGETFRTALHLCRGHFRTYTETAKLFGRFTGTYWIDPHMRGLAERGGVVKDYVLKP